MKVNPRQIILIGFAAIISGLVAWYFFMYQGQLDKIKQVQAEISRLNGQLSRGKMSINNLPKLKSSVNELVMEFDSLSMKLPTKDQVSAMTNDIVEAALAQDLTIDKIQPSIDAMLKSPDYFVKVPIEIVLSGSFLKFGAFLESLYQLPFKIYVTDLSLKRKADAMSISAELNAYFYVINPGGKI